MNILLNRQVSDGASQLEDTVVDSGAQPHRLHGRLEQVGIGLIDQAEGAICYDYAAL